MNPKKAQDNIDHHQNILSEIKEYEAKIQFERDQRVNLVETKKKEIERKEKTINQIKITNQRLQKELLDLQMEVEDRLDQIEYKEKQTQYEHERMQNEYPLKQLAKVKEKELNDSMQQIENYKKEKDQYELELKERIDLLQVNSLNDQIKMANEKVKDLEREVVFLQKIKTDHQDCLKTKEKLELEIRIIKRNIQLLKFSNKEKIRMQKLANSFDNKKPDSTLRKKAQERIEREMKNNLEDFWSKNDKVMSNNSNEMIRKRLQHNNSAKIMITNISHVNKSKSKSNLLMNNIFPPIGLFNSDEKNLLSNIIPLQEIEKYEKRYESLDITKASMERKLALETKLLNRENNKLEDQYHISNTKLKENEMKKQTFCNQINEQKKELSSLKEKLNDLMKQLEDTKAKASEKDEKNRQLAQELQSIQKEYFENNQQGQRSNML